MPQAAAAASSGPLVLGRYRPLRPLGSGGSGTVWLARDERNGLDVALKVVPREGTAESRAEREAAAAARLRHERCLRAYALARDTGHVYIAYEYVPGRTVRQALRAGELNDGATLEAAAQILEGLAHAHARGIVHRDVKPANVLLADGPEVSVKLLDFGLALMREEETLTAVGDIPGTLAYISPERLRGDTAGPAADVWSVGVLLWEALAGRHPFWGGTLLDTADSIRAGAPSLATQRPDLPRQIVRLVDRALAVEPAKRPSAAKLAAGLRQAAEERSRRPARNRRKRPSPSARAHASRLLPAVGAALYAAWGASALSFYPAGWPAGLALLAAAASLASPRAGLALALAVPVFPLGNHALALATAYCVLAAAWLALSWREPRSGLFLVAGPLLAPLGLLGFLPAAAQLVHSPVRRAAQVGAAVLAAGAVAGAGRIGRLGVSGTDEPMAAAAVVWGQLAAHGSLAVEALVLAAAAVALPHARVRGPWAIALYGAAVIALALLPAPGVAALPVVLATWATCVALAAEPWLRTRVRGPMLAARLVPERAAPAE